MTAPTQRRDCPVCSFDASVTIDESGAWCFNCGDVSMHVKTARARPKPEPAPVGGYMRTAFGNAERFLAQHGDAVRYVHQFGQWLAWDGARWCVDHALGIRERAKAVVRSIYDESWLAAEDEGKLLRQWASQCEKPAAVDAMLDLARSDPRVARTADDWDADPDVLNVANGMLDLRTGALMPHDRDANCTKVVPVLWDRNAACPTWEAFLARVVPDAETRDMLRIAVGYSLTGHTREQCLLLLWGSGRNGKSTFFDVLRLLAGDYATQADFETFLDKGLAGGGARNDLARLHGARVVTTSEANEGRRLNEGLVKSLTGGDTIAARFLYKEAFEFTPQFTLWMAANHRPVIYGTDDGIWRRMRLVPFTVQIPEAEADKALGAKLKAELPGILAWAVSGAVHWYERGLPLPAAVRAATADYREESDTLAPFLEERCEVGERFTVPAGALFRAYVDWCKAMDERPVNQTVFGRRMTDRGFGVEKLGGNLGRTKVRRGLRIKDEPAGGGLL